MSLFISLFGYLISYFQDRTQMQGDSDCCKLFLLLFPPPEGSALPVNGALGNRLYHLCQEPVVSGRLGNLQL